MGTDWLAAIASIRANIGVYLARNGKLDAKQTAALATDLKTLDRDLAGLAASFAAATPKVVAVRGFSMRDPDPDTYWYMRQLITLERDPSLEASFTGVWPAEATDPSKRPAAIAQLVAGYLAEGPAKWPASAYPPLANADVTLAASFPTTDFNPVFAAALAGAAKEAAANPSGFCDIGTDTTVRVITPPNEGGTAWGTVGVSGRFATFEVLGQ